MSIAAKRKEKVKEANDWALDYLVKREEKWKKRVKKLRKQVSEEELDLERLCFNAVSFRSVYVKLEKVGAEEDIDDFFPSQSLFNIASTFVYFDEE